MVSADVRNIDGGVRHRLTEDEIKTMLDSAAEHANTDKELRENLEAKQSLESYCFQLKNYVTDSKLDEVRVNAHSLAY